LNFKIYNNDVFAALKQMQEQAIKVDCVITSPPYWGLRDYGIDGQIGLEKHPQEYIQKIVSVFSEVKKVLKPEGSVWLNLGDTYFGGGGGNYGTGLESKKECNPANFLNRVKEEGYLVAKQKMLIPHRVAIAMQEDGWILRNDVVWHKPSHMPSSVTDRLTNSFEYLFHFVQRKKYYYDLDAIREPHKEVSLERIKKPWNGERPNMASWSGMKIENMCNEKGKNPADVWDLKSSKIDSEKLGSPRARLNREGYSKDNFYHAKGKNPSDFWSINTEPYPEAHFACFPTKLVRKPLQATCPKEGTVLDPFVGSGTTLLEAQKQCKSGIGIEINPEYVKLIKKRLLGDEHQSTLVPNVVSVIS